MAQGFKFIIMAVCLMTAACHQTGNGEHPNGKIAFHDSFDEGIDESKWSLIKGKTVRIQHETVRSGDGALEADGDFRNICRLVHGEVPKDLVPDDGNCTKNEVRLAERHLLRAGPEIWYGFSLQVRGSVSKSGSVRTILAQWKEDGRANPVLAFRYDNGIFHASVQENRCRELITDREQEIGSVVGRLEEPLLQPEAAILPRKKKMKAKQPTLTDALQAFLPNTGTDPVCPDGPSNIQTEVIEELPDPFEKWVDIALMLKRDLTNGRVEIWADGKLRGIATGHIGSDFPWRYPENGFRPPQNDEPPFLYEKFGIYGDICALRNEGQDDARVAICRVGRMTAYYDNFRRGTSRAEVDPSILYP